MDPLAGSQWSAAGTVAGFAQAAPNPQLMCYAAWPASPLRVVDIGCGAGRNAVPLSFAGHHVVGTDLSWPMLTAATGRGAGPNLQVALAPMDALPVRDRSIDLVVAHGIWNLARSDAEFRRAVREAARVARPGARLFVFTFSRRTVPFDAVPFDGNALTYTQFSGSPQIFLTADQLRGELSRAGFVPDSALPLRELNVPPPGQLRAGGPPVIFEGGFRFSGA
jgi:SAM-dependent methyltransferase